MLVEEQTYTTHPGKWREYLALFEAEGWAAQRRILGRMVGYYHTEIGELNQIVHLWAYTDLDERAERRAALRSLSCIQGVCRQDAPPAAEAGLPHPEAAPFFTPVWQEVADPKRLMAPSLSSPTDKRRPNDKHVAPASTSTLAPWQHLARRGRCAQAPYPSVPCSWYTVSAQAETPMWWPASWR